MALPEPSARHEPFEEFLAPPALEDAALVFTLREIAAQNAETLGELLADVEATLGTTGALRLRGEYWDTMPEGRRGQDWCWLSSIAADALDRWPDAEERREEDGTTWLCSRPGPYRPGVRTVAEFRERFPEAGAATHFGALVGAILRSSERLAAAHNGGPLVKSACAGRR